MPRFAWGIDIGDGTLKAVRLKKESRGFRVIQAVEIPYLDPFTKQKTLPPAVNRRALAALRQFKEKVQIRDLDMVAVGFPSFHAVEGVIEVPRVDEKQQHELIQYEITSRFKGKLEELKTQYKELRIKSSEMRQVMTFCVKEKEYRIFMACLEEAGIPFDRIVTSMAALVDGTRMGYSGLQQVLVLSPGFSATHMLILQGGEFWARTLPIGLPGTPGETIDVAKNQVRTYCEMVRKEVLSFALSSLGEDGYNPEKILISGEGARVPSLINALDSTLRVPVELMRPAVRVSGHKNMPPVDTVFSMGKAIGLAAGTLLESRRSCVLESSPPGRRAMRKLPALSVVCAILLLLVMGFYVIEWDRQQRLGLMEDGLRMVEPDHPIRELADLHDDITTLSEEVDELNRIHKDREFLKNLGRLLIRLESKSIKGTFGDYHLLNLGMGFTDAREFNAMLATRRDADEETLSEIRSLFPQASRKPELTGPLPAEEETPPEGMAPLVLFEVRGDLR